MEILVLNWQHIFHHVRYPFIIIKRGLTWIYFDVRWKCILVSILWIKIIHKFSILLIFSENLDSLEIFLKTSLPFTSHPKLSWLYIFLWKPLNFPFIANTQMRVNWQFSFLSFLSANCNISMRKKLSPNPILLLHCIIFKYLKSDMYIIFC